MLTVGRCSVLAVYLHLLFASSSARWASSETNVTTSDTRKLHNGVVLSLETRPGHIRGLLRNGTLPVMGSVREVGYFFTKIALGTPKREFTVIIDTGSTITYVPCINCQHCGKHQDPAFDPKQSSTFQDLPCGNHKCDCGSPPCSCLDRKCYYTRSYAEQSSSEGWLVEDLYSFPDGRNAVPFVFGCENKETGEIYRQTADGIMGMGNNAVAFQSQLVRAGTIDDTFGLCFGWPSNGALLLGDVALPQGSTMQYTPLQQRAYHVHYYNVAMEGISAEGSFLKLPDKVFEMGYGTVMDSGTTFTHLPSPAFEALVESLTAALAAKGHKREQGSDPQYPDICWLAPFRGFADMDGSFPTLSFTFAGGVSLSLPPMRYLFLMKPGEFCLGIFNNQKSGALIGGITVRNMLVQYDRRHKRIGFMEANCSALLALPPGVSAPGPVADAPASGPRPSTSPLPDSNSKATTTLPAAAVPAGTPSTATTTDRPHGDAGGGGLGGYQYSFWFLTAVAVAAVLGALGLGRLAHSRCPQWDERVVACVVVGGLVAAVLLSEVAMTGQSSLVLVWHHLWSLLGGS